MGIFSGSMISTVDSIIDVQEAVGYEDIAGVQEAMLESYENQYKMFEGTIISDIQEAQMRANGVDEDELMSFSEGVISDLIDKLKEFFKKLWAKIKAIFRAFMAKIDSVFMKSNKEFVNKYKSEVLRKDLTDFEVKYRKRKKEFSNIVAKGSFSIVNLELKTNSVDKIEKAIEDFDTEDETCNWINSMVSDLNISELKEFDKEFMDSIFEDPETQEYKDVNGLMNELINFKDTKKGINEFTKAYTKWINDIVKTLDKEENEIIKNLPMKDTDTVNYQKLQNPTKQQKQSMTEPTDFKFGREKARDLGKKAVLKYQKNVRLSSMYAGCLQTAISKVTAGAMKAAKFDNAQNRRIFAAMVAYRKKSEDTLFTEAFMDLAEYEADCVGVY